MCNSKIETILNQGSFYKVANMISCNHCKKLFPYRFSLVNHLKTESKCSLAYEKMLINNISQHNISEEKVFNSQCMHCGGKSNDPIFSWVHSQFCIYREDTPNIPDIYMLQKIKNQQMNL